MSQRLEIQGIPFPKRAGIFPPFSLLYCYRWNLLPPPSLSSPPLSPPLSLFFFGGGGQGHALFFQESRVSQGLGFSVGLEKQKRPLHGRCVLLQTCWGRFGGLPLLVPGAVSGEGGASLEGLACDGWVIYAMAAALEMQSSRSNCTACKAAEVDATLARADRWGLWWADHLLGR